MFLEVGHTQNENDSVHSTIERASRRQFIYTPDQWSSVARGARHGKPYTVKDMDLLNFFNFKAVAQSIKNFEITEDNEQIKWTKLRCLQFDKNEPDIMSVRYSYSEPFKRVNLLRRKRKSSTAPAPELRQLRSQKNPLSKEKYKDLKSLCDKLLIPEHYHDFLHLCLMINNQ